MRYFLKVAAVLAATAAVTAGCTIDRPTRSDGTGPVINVEVSGGANFAIDNETPRRTPADSCAIVGGAVSSRSVSLRVVVLDQSGMNNFRFRVEGEGIRRGSVTVNPPRNPLLNVSDTRDVDEITLTFLPVADGVLNGAVVDFVIDSTFTGGVTLSAFAVDGFGNDTELAPFELRSDLAVGTCNF